MHTFPQMPEEALQIKVSVMHATVDPKWQEDSSLTSVSLLLGFSNRLYSPEHTAGQARRVHTQAAEKASRRVMQISLGSSGGDSEDRVPEPLPARPTTLPLPAREECWLVRSRNAN